MSNLSNINTKLPAEGQPDPTETLDVGPPTSIAHNIKCFRENTTLET